MHKEVVNLANNSQSLFLSFRKEVGHFDMSNDHFHDMYEIYYLLSGERYYFIKERSYYVKKGDLVFLNIHDLHKTTDTGVPDHQRILLHFTKNYLPCGQVPFLSNLVTQLFETNQPIIRFPRNEQIYIEELLFSMVKELQNKKTGYEPFLISSVMNLLVFACRFVERNSDHFFEHPSPLHKKISEIVQYINNHFPEAISLTSVAEQFYISPFYLSRVFKEITGFTFIEYLNSIRIKEAQQLLQNSKMKVTTIIEKVGFRSIAHFGRVFKATTGISPLQYRKINTQ